MKVSAVLPIGHDERAVAGPSDLRAAGSPGSEVEGARAFVLVKHPRTMTASLNRIEDTLAGRAEPRVFLAAAVAAGAR